jgi:hypothetical protein
MEESDINAIWGIEFELETFSQAVNIMSIF